MSEKHLNIETIADYYLNRLEYDQETKVQEHLRQCPSCRKKLEDMRNLHNAFYEEPAEIQISVFRKIISSTWTKAAASVVVILGAGFLIYQGIVTRNSSREQFMINSGMNNVENQVFAIDSFDKEDSMYYHEKYGEDFGK